MIEAVREFVLRLGDGAQVAAEICAGAVRALFEGHVCVRLSSEQIACLERVEGLVTAVEAQTPPAQVSTPFVRAESLLYTRRNWRYERTVRDRLCAMIAARAEGPEPTLPETDFYRALRAEQREAVLAMCRERLTLLTGGPGTGKTHTLARAVARMRELEPTLRLALAAPTGKAAARMTEALAAALPGASVPRATTLEGLLGSRYDGVTFRHNRENPLPIDWLIIDEASMIGLPMMAKLLDALPEACRLTLVGDVDQLASVERGHVLGDLCHLRGLRLCRLRQSARFPAGGAIARLAAAVNDGEVEAALRLLHAGDDLVRYRDLRGCDPFHPARWADFAACLAQGFQAFARARSPEEALAHLNDFRLLCALRRGPYGLERLNAFVRRSLGPRAPQPVMISRNDAALGVANGDIGVVMPQAPDRLYLPTGGAARAIRLAFLPSTEPAYASTVHKAQGSEFTDVAILLPPQGDSPLLTREVLYTAITRTRRRVHLYAGDEAVARCCTCAVERLSGLR